MPKKTAYSRSGAQRSSKSKQKSFELVRPVSHDTVPETTKSSEEIEMVDEAVSEKEEAEAVEERASATEAVEEPASAKEKVQTTKRSSAQESVLSSVTIATSSDTPQSASVRLAARRQMAQKEKAHRSSTSLISAENYNYVRKDLIFILILAVIMFSAIIIMHFVPAIGG